MVCSSILARPCANSYIARRLPPVPGRICCLCQILHEGKERRRLADEPTMAQRDVTSSELA
jgi:hypothetical protein